MLIVRVGGGCARPQVRNGVGEGGEAGAFEDVCSCSNQGSSSGRLENQGLHSGRWQEVAKEREGSELNFLGERTNADEHVHDGRVQGRQPQAAVLISPIPSLINRRVDPKACGSVALDKAALRLTVVRSKVDCVSWIAVREALELLVRALHSEVDDAQV